MKVSEIFKYKRIRIWAIVSSALVILLLVASILTTTVFYELLKSVIGGERRVSDSSTGSERYVSDYESKDEAYTAANKLNERVNEEGIVLLKNENNVLPLKKSQKVSVFGKNSVDLVYGGSGSGAGSSEGRKTIYESLQTAGIEYNADLKSFYEDETRSGAKRPSNPPIENSGVYLNTGETPLSSYSNDLWDKCNSDDYETALFVVSRIGGEGFDLPRSMQDKAGTGAVEGANATDHYLQLDENERQLLEKICSLDKVKNVVVIINCSTSFELGFLDDMGHYAYNDKITGALWIGGPGNSGIMALGRVLNGEVNPSGRLIDTYARDFTKDPTYENFGNNMLTEKKGKYTFTGNQYMESTSKSYPYYFVDYEEGIYVGYKYYETRGFTEGDSSYTDANILGSTTDTWNNWYDAHVVFPFGYGLSYTSFEKEVVNAEELSAHSLSSEKFTVKVKVTNTGSTAGKEVVQLYVTSPYTYGGIEKSHKQLCGFVKTPTLYPASEAGEKKPNSVELEITVEPYDFASYDYNDANANGFKGYELEAGDYLFSVSENAHHSVGEVKIPLKESIKFETDAITGKKVENLFDGTDDQLSSVSVAGQTRKGLSRSDFEGTKTTTRRAYSDRIVDSSFIDQLKNVDSGNKEVITDMPNQSTQATESGGTRLNELTDKAYDDEKWESFLNQITIADMGTLVSNGNFKSPAIVSVGKPETLESDGPVGFVNFMDTAGRYYGTCSYASECVMAATWNVELLNEVGQSIGNEGIWGNDKGDGTPYSGLYAPGANIHRSPFSGRNFEYFSEDGFLSGKLAANEIAGAREKGVYMYMKHFALNDQETHRDQNGISVWATEQSMRELYFKPFEIAVKEGKTTAIMSSFNRIGTVWAGGDYRLLTELLRKEWGFEGTVISDFNLSVYMNAKQMHYAGGDLNLTTMPDNRWNYDATNATDVSILRRCTKNIMYTVANSCAMNSEVSGYLLPYWVIALICLDSAVLVGTIAWGFFAVRSVYKKKNGSKE